MSNDDINRALGRLEGRIESIQSDVSDIKSEIKDLKSFKFKVAGAAAAISALVAFAGWLIGVVK